MSGLKEAVAFSICLPGEGEGGKPEASRVFRLMAYSTARRGPGK